MKSSMGILGWVSMTVAFAILGMGGAPIAEYAGLPWLVVALKWVAYVSVGLLAIATVFIGGIGIHHGILTILGRTPGRVSHEVRPAPLPSRPQVESSPPAPGGAHG